MQSQILLLLATFIIAISGLIYELLAGTLSSYLLGDSIYQFSIVIGLFMTAMGIGAYLSRFVQNNLEYSFIIAQISLGMIGGLSALILFYAFVYIHNYEIFLVLCCLLIGGLMGLEIPLITRILQKNQILKLNISNVLTADYIGALVAALLFPIVLVPKLGLMATSLVFGLLNLGVAIMTLFLFKLQTVKKLIIIISICVIVLIYALINSHNLVNFFEKRLYQDPIIFTQTTPYQRIVITNNKRRTRMFINGNLQFDSHDEYRYHESLVHPVMSLSKRPEKVLILGGGDGFAVREVLKYKEVKQIILVDLDPVITNLFKNNSLLSKLNQQALQDKRVKIINADAWQYLHNSNELYNVIIADFPDPHTPNISKLYTRSFYKNMAKHLSRDGLFVTQATSPFYARKAFWCINNTLAATPNAYKNDRFLDTQAYHSYTPSFGEWGFILASSHQINWAEIKLTKNLDFRYLNNNLLSSMTKFNPDMEYINTEINTIHAHPLLQYYETGWNKWFP
jgi:spermidine synthase